ncbi:MAG TPA: DNA polymerase III subunit delta [Gemmatimonadaceae bacterium]|nr:DNA polymerase III subunit delta [Gemmatimonadaceae bacterium]
MASPPNPQRVLRKAIQEKAFDPAYYLYGEDDFLKEAAVRDLVAAAVDPATRDFNLDVRRGGDLDGEALAVLLGTLPMMADRRVVVVRDVGALKKDARGALDRYLERPSTDTVVVLVAPAGAKSDKALCDRATALEFAPLTGDRLPKWIAHYASTELGASITDDAVALLQSAVGSELPQLAAELDKLASYANGGEIDERAVSEVVGVRHGETLGDLLDRVAMRDATGALALVDHVMSQPKTTAVSVVMALTTQTLALAWGQAMRQSGTSPGALAKGFFDLLKEGGSFPGRPWGEAASAWTKAVDRWDAPSLDHALELLLAADVALKESKISSEEQILASLVLGLCVGPGSARGAAA